MLRKDTIQKVELETRQFVFGKQERWRQEATNKSETFEQFYSIPAFKMEGMHLVKDLLQENNFLIKIDLKDVYFGFPLDKTSRKYIRFRWEGNLYKFLCLCFGLGPAPLIFTKILKIPFALIRRINIRIIIFLGDILVMAQNLREIIQARKTSYKRWV